MRQWIFSAAVLAVAGGAAAQQVAAQPPAGQDAGKIAITIYNNDLALVEDARVMSVDAGRSRLEFPNVSARIQPETVSLAADGVSIVEQNFDFDLLTPYKMMEKAVGSTIRLVRTNPATGRETVETAKVLSANEGVVLQIGDRIEVLRDDGLPVRVLFDRIPPNLRAKPTLSVTVNSAAAGRRTATLRYLTNGVRWQADYVGLFDEKSGSLNLQGWVTLTNQTGAAYVNARTQLIAGSPGDGGGVIESALAGGVGGAQSDETAFSDYHLYTLKEPTTIAENQTKQVSFLDAPKARANKIYLVERSGLMSQRYAEGASVKLRLKNDTPSGLGAPLPAGTVRLYAKDSAGRAQFIGEDSLGHIAQGSTIELNVGTAFDVTAQSSVEKQEEPVKGVTVTQMRYVFRNARAEPVTIQFVQGGIDGDHEFLESSMTPTRIDAQSYRFDVATPARGEAVVTFTLREGTEEKDQKAK